MNSRFRFRLSLLALLASTPMAYAQTSIGPNTLSLTCQQAEALVKQRETVAMRTGDRIVNRYTSTGTICYRERQNLKPAFVQTRDKDDCFIGYICVMPEARVSR